MTITSAAWLGRIRQSVGQAANSKPPVRRPPAGGKVAGDTNPEGPNARIPQPGLATMTRRVRRYYEAGMRRMAEATDPAKRVAWREVVQLIDYVAMWCCLQAYRTPRHRAVLLAAAQGALREAERRAREIG
jgi:hypothetical protein